MSPPLLIPLPGNEALCRSLAAAAGYETGALELHRFPDGESLPRFAILPEGRDVVLICTFDRPDEKLLPLAFAADAARDLGARSVGLAAPYLAYLRQDRRFAEGEAITSVTFARLLSSTVDWLVTIDPHLHRYASLDEVYRVPSTVLHATALIARWIAREVPNPLLVGPDSESAQWVSAVAQAAGAAAIVLEKTRRGDRDVSVSVPDVGRWRDHTPVLVDDIISTGRTMIETVGHLQQAGLRPPVCIGVHAIFAASAYDDLLAAGAARIVTCNTVTHPSNGIDVADLLADGIASQIKAVG